MIGTLTIPMQATCTAWYLVSCDLDPDEARSSALRMVDRHASGVMREMVDETASAISFGAVTEQDLTGMTEEQQELILETRGWVSIRVQVPTPWWPEHEWVARTLAGLLATRYGRHETGLVLDMTTATRTDGDQLLASLHAKESGSVRVADWIRVGHGWDTSDWRLQTRGMCRYGLPELQVRKFGYNQEEGWCALLTAIAFRVIVDELRSAENHLHNQAVIVGQTPPRNVPSQLEVSDEIRLAADDVADAYCLPGSFESRRWGTRWGRGKGDFGCPETPIQLTFDEASHTLIVEPPSEWRDSEDKRGRHIPGALPEWRAIDEALPMVRRWQLVQECVRRSVVDDILADPDLVTR
jgi:hypothetical protein